VVSEYGTQVGIARARAAAVAGTPGSDDGFRTVVEARLAAIPDPELPGISIVDLGMIESIDVDPTGIRVELLPTFIGCPALDVIQASVVEALGGLDLPVEVRPTFRVPWTTDRITPAGREALARAGIAPPPDGDGSPSCPLCGSGDVVLDSSFGPTQCRSLYYCRGCRQPFEAMKTV
jgi:ring-1,2-phenylacetyl-CoA epoxidase subunit PaaD